MARVKLIHPEKGEKYFERDDARALIHSGTGWTMEGGDYGVSASALADSTGEALAKRAASGITLGLSDIALEAAGLQTPESKSIETEENPTLSLGAEIGGSLLTAPLASSASALKWLSPTNVMAMGAASKFGASKIAGVAVGSALQAATETGIRDAGEHAFGRDGFTAEQYAKSMGLAALLGGMVQSVPPVAKGAYDAGTKLWQKASGKLRPPSLADLASDLPVKNPADFLDGMIKPGAVDSPLPASDEDRIANLYRAAGHIGYEPGSMPPRKLKYRGKPGDMPIDRLEESLSYADPKFPKFDPNDPGSQGWHEEFARRRAIEAEKSAGVKAAQRREDEFELAIANLAWESPKPHHSALIQRANPFKVDLVGWDDEIADIQRRWTPNNGPATFRKLKQVVQDAEEAGFRIGDDELLLDDKWAQIVGRENGDVWARAVALQDIAKTYRINPGLERMMERGMAGWAMGRGVDMLSAVGLLGGNATKKDLVDRGLRVRVKLAQIVNNGAKNLADRATRFMEGLTPTTKSMARSTPRAAVVSAGNRLMDYYRKPDESDDSLLDRMKAQLQTFLSSPDDSGAELMSHMEPITQQLGHEFADEVASKQVGMMRAMDAVIPERAPGMGYSRVTKQEAAVMMRLLHDRQGDDEHPLFDAIEGGLITPGLAKAYRENLPALWASEMSHISKALASGWQPPAQVKAQLQMLGMESTQFRSSIAAQQAYRSKEQSPIVPGKQQRAANGTYVSGPTNNLATQAQSMEGQ